MSVKFNVVERGKPGDPEAPTKFYPSIISSGRIDERGVAEKIALISTASTADIMASVEGLLLTIPQELAAGHIVELGDFGSFWLRTTAEGADSAEAVRATQIKTLLPRFYPGKEFRKILASIVFEKL